MFSFLDLELMNLKRLNYLGTSIFSMICLIISFVVIPSISFSGVSITRCFNTGVATNLISSGVTKSRPFIAAIAFAVDNIAKDARGDAPKYKEALFRV